MSINFKPRDIVVLCLVVIIGVPIMAAGVRLVFMDEPDPNSVKIYAGIITAILAMVGAYMTKVAISKPKE